MPAYCAMGMAAGLSSIDSKIIFNGRNDGKQVSLLSSNPRKQFCESVAHILQSARSAQRCHCGVPLMEFGEHDFISRNSLHVDGTTSSCLYGALVGAHRHNCGKVRWETRTKRSAHANVVRCDNTKTCGSSAEQAALTTRSCRCSGNCSGVPTSCTHRWVLLLMCAAWSDQRIHRLSPRGMVPMCGIAPALFRVQALLSAKVPAHLPLSMGVLPLTNAIQTKVSCSLAELGRERRRGLDAPTNNRQRHDRALIVTQCFQSVGNCEQVLIAGLATPSWTEIACNTAAVYPEPTGQVWQAKSFGATSGEAL